MSPGLKSTFEAARYAIHSSGGRLRADNDANGLSFQFSGAQTIVDAGIVERALRRRLASARRPDRDSR